MITVELKDGTRATVTDGVWSVPENDELERIFNSECMRPPSNGYYAPSEDHRCAMFIVDSWGGKLVSTTETSEPGVIY